MKEEWGIVWEGKGQGFDTTGLDFAYSLGGLSLLCWCHCGNWEPFPSRPQQIQTVQHACGGIQQQLKKHFSTTVSDWAALCCSTGLNWFYTDEEVHGEIKVFKCTCLLVLNVCVCNVITSCTKTKTPLSDTR